MEAYKIDNKTSVVGLFLLLATIIVGGFLVGASIYLIDQIIYLVLLFPALFGLLTGFLLFKAIKIGKVRIPVLAVLCGIAMAVMTYGSYHYLDYLTARHELHDRFAQKLQSKYGNNSGLIAERAIDESLAEVTGFPGFVGYMIFKGQQGVRIGLLFSSNAKEPLNPILTWLYWLVELLIIAGITSITALYAAKQPFCSIHDRWYPKREHFGGVPLDQAKDLFLLLQAGKFSDVGQLLQEAVPFPSMELYLQSCENCSDSPSLLQLEINLYNKKNGRAEVRRSLSASLSPLAKTQLIQGTRKSAFENQVATPNVG